MSENHPKETKPTKFGLINWIILGVAVILIAVGFISLARGSITLAPILLVLGYCVAVPLALLLRIKRKVSGNA